MASTRANPIVSGEDAEVAGIYCPMFHHTVEVLGRRWVGVILLAMRGGLGRFTDIRDTVPGLSDRLLSQRLRELEDEGLVTRHEDHGQVRYELSEAGHALSPVIDSIQHWTDNWADRPRPAEDIPR